MPDETTASLHEALKDDALLRSMLHDTMAVVRRCSALEDEHGLCECARFIGTQLRMAAQIGTAVVAAYESLLARPEGRPDA